MRQSKAQRIPAGVIVLAVVIEEPTPAQVLDMLIRDVRRHPGGRPQDDQALLALRRSPG
ncbi:hypothetical protein ACFT7S_12640 [Streptomyces sp. NPDC057136]|uniref:hypothetical protein n=1 Tax=Streptomyces sp. NPDC057136 TaxID=3346029 RepID=UPI003625DF1B